MARRTVKKHPLPLRAKLIVIMAVCLVGLLTSQYSFERSAKITNHKTIATHQIGEIDSATESLEKAIEGLEADPSHGHAFNNEPAVVTDEGKKVVTPQDVMPHVSHLVTAAELAEQNLIALRRLGYDTSKLDTSLVSALNKAQPELTETIENIHNAGSAGVEPAIDSLAVIQRRYDNYSSVDGTRKSPNQTPTQLAPLFRPDQS